MSTTLLDPQRRRFVRTLAGGTIVAAVPLSVASPRRGLQAHLVA